ncbi:hypothetical protein ACTA71_006135 [Dictyostelium dimigraforme]
MIKYIFNRFYSPKNYDDISIKKTKYNIFIFIILLLVFHFIVFIVTLKDSNDRLTFIESKIENDLEIPHFIIFSNISSFSYNVLNIKDITEQQNFKNPCEFDYLNGNYSCLNNSNLIDVDEDEFTFYPVFMSLNITFQKTYIRLISNILSNPNATKMEKRNEKQSFIDFQDQFYLSIAPPSRVEILLKKEVIIDRYGTEKVNLSPSVISTPLLSDICQNLITNGSQPDCFVIDISILYQTNIVLYYSEETDRQYFTRVLAEISSISRLVLYLVFSILTFIITRFLFDQKTAWFPNSIRDGVLYHYKHYRVEHNLIDAPKGPPFIYRVIGKLENLFKNEKNEIALHEERNQYEKLKDVAYKTKKATQGSKNIYKRIFQGIDVQDNYSHSLSKVAKIRLLIFVSIMTFLSIIIIIKNAPNRMVTTQFKNQPLLELPKFNYSLISDDLLWQETLVILPNGESRQCSSINGCKQSSNFENITLIENQQNLFVPPDSIYMNQNQKFQFKANYSIHMNGNKTLDVNMIAMKLTINEIEHIISPFSNVTVLLEKTVFRKYDKSTINMYDNNIIVSTVFPRFDYENETDIFLSGFSYLTFQYPNNEERIIKVETNFQLLKRLVQYILAFSSPLSIIIGFIFSNIVIRLLFKSPSAHCDPTVREPIIYFLKYYKSYPKIFKDK